MEEKINKLKSMTNEQLESIIYIHRIFIHQDYLVNLF